MPPTILTEHSLAYVSLNSKEIEYAQNLITKLNKEATKVGLHLNANKTELMAFNFTNTVELKTVSSVENFRYLGSYIISTEKDFGISKALSMVHMPQKEKGLEIQPF